MYYRTQLAILTILMALSGCILPMVADSNQVAITFSQKNIGVLGDYEKTIASWEFATDAQVQRSETTSLILNASIQRNFGSFGIKPFIAYNQDDIGGIMDAGGVLNFSVGDIDISGGASFRGANPTEDPGLVGFDADGNEIKYFTDDPSNSYSLPNVNISILFFRRDLKNGGSRRH